MELHGSFTLRLIRDGKEILRHHQNNKVVGNGANWLLGKECKNTSNGVISAGLNHAGFFLDKCAVGEGRSAVTGQEITLENFYMYNTDAYAASYSTAEDLPNRRLKSIVFRTFLFDITESKNLTEVGCVAVASNVNVLTTRALITDVTGNPQTISVINGDLLFIDYQVECYLPITVTKSQATLKNPEGQDEQFTIWDYWTEVKSSQNSFKRNMFSSTNYQYASSTTYLKSTTVPTIAEIDNALTNGKIQTTEQKNYISSILGTANNSSTNYSSLTNTQNETRVREEMPEGFKHIVTLGPLVALGEIRAIRCAFPIGNMMRIFYRNSDGGGYLKVRPDRIQYECGVNVTMP